MDPNESEKAAPDPQGLETLLEESAESRRLKRNLLVRVAGFALLVLAFALMVLWQKGALAPMFQIVAYVIGGAGVLLYLGARILSYRSPRRH